MNGDVLKNVIYLLIFFRLILTGVFLGCTNFYGLEFFRVVF